MNRLELWQVHTLVMVSIKAVLCLPSSASLFADDFNERRAFTFHVEWDACNRWVDAFDSKVNIWLRRRKQIMCQNKIDDYIIDQLLRKRERENQVWTILFAHELGARRSVSFWISIIWSIKTITRILKCDMTRGERGRKKMGKKIDLAFRAWQDD